MVKVFKSQSCDTMIELLNGDHPMVCCGEEMKELKANTSDGAGEKHVPVIEISEDGLNVKVKVGEVEHPMTEEHHIAFIILETEKGVQKAYLDHTGKPEAEFALVKGDKVVAAYEYCNLHGLWKAEA